MEEAAAAAAAAGGCSCSTGWGGGCSWFSVTILPETMLQSCTAQIYIFSTVLDPVKLFF